MYSRLMEFAPQYDLVSSGFINSEKIFCMMIFVVRFEIRMKWNIFGEECFANTDARVYMGEDALLVWKYLLDCNRVLFLQEAYYHHNNRKDSVVHKKYENALENVNWMYSDFKKKAEQHCLKEFYG